MTSTRGASQEIRSFTRLVLIAGLSSIAAGLFLEILGVEQVFGVDSVIVFAGPVLMLAILWTMQKTVRGAW